MSSEAHVKSFYLNFPTKPAISKQKVQKIDLKKWETSLKDFNENNLPHNFSSSKSNAIYTKLNLCNKKSNGIRKKTFFKSAPLKRISVSDKNFTDADFSALNNHPTVLSSISFDQSPQKEKKTRLLKNSNFNICDIQSTFQKKSLSIKCSNVPQLDTKSKRSIFSENTYKSLKRKSMFEKNNIETDFSSVNSLPKHFCSSFSNQSPRKEKKIGGLKNTRFNICDIQTSFEKKSSDFRCDNVLSQALSPKLDKCGMFEIVKDMKKPISKNNFNIHEEFSQNISKGFVQKNDSLLNISRIENGASTDKCFGGVKHKPAETDQCTKLEKVKDVKKPISKCNLNIFEEFSQHNVERLVPKNGCAVNTLPIENGFETTESFKEVKHEPDKTNQCARFENVKKPISKHSFIIPDEFSQDRSTKVLPKNFMSLTESLIENDFKIAEIFEGMEHKPDKADLQEISKNLFKTDPISIRNLKCNSPSIGVGSKWVHSLQQLKDDHSYLAEKKKIRNVLVGGYCEQILKFERRELSEKAIYEHRNGLKNKSESLLMRINSIVHEYEIVVAECLLLDKSAIPEELVKDASGSFMLNEGHTYVAFFQKSSFHKQQMKMGKFFLLTLPWHLIQLKSFKFPVIICKFFKCVELEQIQGRFSTNEKPNENEMKCQHSELIQCNPGKNYQSKISVAFEANQENIFFTWKKRLNLSSRIQRIWNHTISIRKFSMLLGYQNIYR